ncbi:MAG TPA: VCBS repeat-containing protein [Planctomycetota bacterium]|nr:VCBS repeat-containing protein [Planctomycetota bacterium]
MLRAPLACLSAVALLAGSAAASQQFHYDPFALQANSVWSNGVILVDVDGDEDLDIVVANGSVFGGTGAQGAQPQELWLNDGAGLFAAAGANLHVANFNAQMVIGEDFDVDGDVDLMYASGSTGSPPRLLLNDGLGVFTDVTASKIPALALRSDCVCAGDVDDDGDADVVVTDGGTFSGTPSQARLLANNGSAAFSDVTAARMPADLFNCQDACLLDVDGDLDIDIALSGKGSATLHGRLYVNDGAGNFDIATGLDQVGTSHTTEVDYADVDGDDDFDAVVLAISGMPGVEGWARNDGDDTPWVKTTFTGSLNQDDNEIVPFDYDVDGDMDVLVGSMGTSERLYANDGAGNFSLLPGAVQAEPDSTLDVAVGDVDGDGALDFVTAQGATGSFTEYVYLNAGAPDTLPPVYVQVETPSRIGAIKTVFHVQLKDQIADDGQIGVKVTYSYATSGAGSGSGTATSMGHGLYRAAVPSSGATSILLTWTATDGAGNVAVNGPIQVGTLPVWTDLGFALAGVSGNPSLVGTGPLSTGSAGSLVLSNAAPSAPCVLFVSVTSMPVSVKGGTLAAFPGIVTLPFSTDGSGALPLAWTDWPSGLSGLSLFFQYLIADSAAPVGVALSNCEEGDVP